jgi:hypothetical protein
MNNQLNLFTQSQPQSQPEPTPRGFRRISDEWIVPLEGKHAGVPMHQQSALALALMRVRSTT